MIKKNLKAIAIKIGVYEFSLKLRRKNEINKLIRGFWELSEVDAERLEFYKQFVCEGSLVFDVGANFGNRSKIFALLNSVVVAVEPQKECAVFLRRTFQGRKNFYLVEKALGSFSGESAMFVSDLHTVSTLSNDWIQAVKESGRFSKYGVKWERKQNVLVDTLDNLILEYGNPDFIKVDVEGFEYQVVSGLSYPVKAISLEFTPEFLESTIDCVKHLSKLGNYKFQISLGESMKFHLPEWVGSNEIQSKVESLPSNIFGDIYACLAR